MDEYNDDTASVGDPIPEASDESHTLPILKHQFKLGPKAQERYNRGKSLASLEQGSTGGISFIGDPKLSRNPVGIKSRGKDLDTEPRNSPQLSSTLSSLASPATPKEDEKNERLEAHGSCWDTMSLEQREELLPKLDSLEVEHLTGMTESQGLEAAKWYENNFGKSDVIHDDNLPQEQISKNATSDGTTSTGVFYRIDSSSLSPEQRAQKEAGAQKLIKERIVFAFEQECMAADQDSRALPPKTRSAILRNELELVDITGAFLHKYRHENSILKDFLADEKDANASLHRELDKIKGEWKRLVDFVQRLNQEVKELRLLLGQAGTDLQECEEQLNFEEVEVVRLASINKEHVKTIAENKKILERSIQQWKAYAEEKEKLAQKAQRECEEVKRKQNHMKHRRTLLPHPTPCPKHSRTGVAANVTYLPAPTDDSRKHHHAVYKSGVHRHPIMTIDKKERENWIRKSPVFVEHLTKLRRLREMESYEEDGIIVY